MEVVAMAMEAGEMAGTDDGELAGRDMRGYLGLVFPPSLTRKRVGATRNRPVS